jgi:aryl-alcohol dehydrogenase-like predicted oxidoreductase
VIEQVPLGRTGVSVSRVCLGTMNFGGRTDRAEAFRILDRAVAGSVTFIDTANVYGHDPANFAIGRGRSEEIVGEWLAARRPDVVVATKLYFPMHGAPGSLGPSRRNVIRECEASLRRLRTDVIDLYQLHHPSNEVPIDETLRALDDLVTAGKVRYVGTSSFAAWQIVESLWASSARRLVPVSSEQPLYNLLDRRIERELLPMALTYGLAVLTWSPLAGGVLAGRYERGANPPPGSRHETFWAGRHVEVTEEVFDVLDRLGEVATAAGLELHALAHAWVVSQPGITSMIVGPRNVEHLAAALTAAQVRLSAEVLEAIDEVVRPGRATLPQYGHDGLAWATWGPHRYAWR